VAGSLDLLLVGGGLCLLKQLEPPALNLLVQLLPAGTLAALKGVQRMQAAALLAEALRRAAGHLDLHGHTGGKAG
jgi:hypothetical protein